MKQEKLLLVKYLRSEELTLQDGQKIRPTMAKKVPLSQVLLMTPYAQLKIYRENNEKVLENQVLKAMGEKYDPTMVEPPLPLTALERLDKIRAGDPLPED